MLQKAEAIYHKANELVRRCGTRDTLRIASEIGIYIHQIGGFKELLGMYSYQHKERHILLNSNMDCITAQMVCGHEIGHDALHRDQAKIGMGLQEFTLFDMRNEMEYEANAFAAHLRIDSEELLMACSPLESVLRDGLKSKESSENAADTVVGLFTSVQDM